MTAPTDCSALLNTPESWEAARRYAALLGTVPASFQTTIRTLRSEHAAGSKSVTQASSFNVGRLVKSQSVKAALYFATRTYHAETIQSKPLLTDRDLINLYQPGDLAALFAVLYVYRKAQRVCSNEEWQFITKTLHDQTDLAAFIGAAIPRIGLSLGLIVGAMLPLGFAFIAKLKEKEYREYRRLLKSKGITADLGEEQQRFGCTAVQVASILVQATGFGIPYSDALTRGITTFDIYDKALEGDALAVKTLHVWVESMQASGAAPDLRHRGEFYPLKEVLDRLVSQVEKVRGNGSLFRWLDKNKDDIAPDKTPQLFPKGAEPATTPTAESPEADEEVIKELGA